MRDTIIIINSFLHDVATGVWIAVLIVMYVISGQAAGVKGTPQGAAFVAGIMDSLWFTAVVSLAVILLTGVVRGLTFKFYGWTGDVARDRKRLLMVKHVILGIVVTAGLYFQFALMSGV